MRTGPLVRRGANASRAAQATVATSRILPRVFAKQHLSFSDFPLPRIAPKAEIRSSCRLPINLRSFLARQLGCQPGASDDTILSYAARADQLTLSRLARAIRRYSTARAHEAWAECSLAVTAFVQAYRDGRLAVLCLRCVRVDFGDTASREHQHDGCLPITLTEKGASSATDISASEVPETIQHLVEEFRDLRTAFGLPHFDLDCYLRGDQLTMMWHPLP